MAAPHDMKVSVRHVYDDEVIVESFDGDYIFRLGRDAFPNNVTFGKSYSIKLVIEELPPCPDCHKEKKDNLRKLVEQLGEPNE
jgi:hypothetical protein